MISVTLCYSYLNGQAYHHFLSILVASFDSVFKGSPNQHILRFLKFNKPQRKKTFVFSKGMMIVHGYE